MNRDRSPIVLAPHGGFTLLEVMISIAILGMGLLALLSLHHQSMQSVIAAQDETRAAMLAQVVMTNAELQRYPDDGATHGDFHELYPNKYPNYSWARIVTESGIFPDVRKVRVIIYYGVNSSRSFAITEFLHNPIPPEEMQQMQGNAARQGGAPVGQMAPPTQ
jgi:general secretion pathway protein I